MLQLGQKQWRWSPQTLINRIALRAADCDRQIWVTSRSTRAQRECNWVHAQVLVNWIYKHARRLMWELIENVQTKCGGDGRGVYLNGQGSCPGSNGITTDYATKSSFVRNNCNFIEDI